MLLLSQLPESGWLPTGQDVPSSPVELGSQIFYYQTKNFLWHLNYALRRGPEEG